MQTRTMRKRNSAVRQAWTTGYLMAATVTACIFLVIAQKSNAATTTLNGRNLKTANFQTQNDQIAAGCVGVVCTSPPIFDPALDLVCPVAAGKTCTYYIHLESQVQVSAQDAGLFRLLVDGAAPTPGPTATDGSFTWLDNDPDSDVLSHFEIKSFTVTQKLRMPPQIRRMRLKSRSDARTQMPTADAWQDQDSRSWRLRSIHPSSTAHTVRALSLWKSKGLLRKSSKLDEKI